MVLWACTVGLTCGAVGLISLELAGVCVVCTARKACEVTNNNQGAYRGVITPEKMVCVFFKKKGGVLCCCVCDFSISPHMGSYLLQHSVSSLLKMSTWTRTFACG